MSSAGHVIRMRNYSRMCDLPVRRPVDFREGATGSRRRLHPQVQPSASVSSCRLVALGLVAVGLVAVGLVALAGCAHQDDLRPAALGVELGAGVGGVGGDQAKAVLVAGG